MHRNSFAATTTLCRLAFILHYVVGAITKSRVSNAYVIGVVVVLLQHSNAGFDANDFYVGDECAAAGVDVSCSSAHLCGLEDRAW